jgi:hypothetical protein
MGELENAVSQLTSKILDLQWASPGGGKMKVAFTVDTWLVELTVTRHGYEMYVWLIVPPGRDKIGDWVYHDESRGVLGGLKVLRDHVAIHAAYAIVTNDLDWKTIKQI